MYYSIEVKGRADAIWGYLYEAFVRINGLTWVIVRATNEADAWTRALLRVATV